MLHYSCVTDKYEKGEWYWQGAEIYDVYFTCHAINQQPVKRAFAILDSENPRAQTVVNSTMTVFYGKLIR